MSEIASLYVRIGANVKDFEAGLMSVGAQLSAFGNTLANIGNNLTIGVTLPLAGIGVAAAKSAIELDRSMKNIQSISKESDESLSALRDTFLDMSTDINTTTASANELAEGFYQIQSSGFAGADAMQVLESAAMAGSAGLSTTAVAAEALTAALNAYGEGADQAANYSDIMFKAVDIGVVTFDQLSSSLSNVISTAAATGVEFETVAAAMTTMTKQGMSAAEASVSLNQILTSMLKPSEALAIALGEIGYESGQAALDALGLDGVLRALGEAGYDSSEELAGLFNNVRALRGVLSLTGDGADMFAQDLQAMADASGSTAEAFAIQMESIKAQMDNLRNSATALGVELFDAAAPAFRDILDGAKDLVDAFRDLDPAMQSSIVKWAAIAAAAGPVLSVFGRLVSVIGSVISLVGGLPSMFTSLTASLAGASSAAGSFVGAMASLPLGVVGATAAIGGLIAASEAYKRQTADMQRQAEDYAQKQAEIKAEATGLIDVVNDEANTLGYLGDGADIASEGLGGFADAQMEAWRAASETTDELDEQAQAVQEMAIAFDKASAAMQAAGMSTEAQAQAMSALQEYAGMATDEFDRQAATMEALSQAYTSGLISQEYYNQAMWDAVTNTALLNDAQLALIDNTLAAEANYQRAAAAAGNYAASMYSLAGSFQSASTAADLGQIAMDMLTQSWQNGTINGFQFAEGMKSINDQYGIYSEQALSAAMGTMQLMDAFESGKLTDFGGAYQMMMDNVENGVAPMQGVVEQFGTFEEKLKMVSEMSGKVLDGAMEKLTGTDFESKLDTIGKATDALKTSMENLDGVSITTTFNTNAASVVGPIEEANAAMDSAMDKTVTMTYVITTVYNTIGSPAGGGAASGWTLPQSSGLGKEGGLSGLLNQVPQGVLSSTSTTASPLTSPTVVSQDTYNVYNPLAAAILIEQKHRDNLEVAASKLG